MTPVEWDHVLGANLRSVFLCTQDWPDGVQRWQQTAPLKRVGLPEDVADACLFLASPAARWVTGASLLVDGGVITHQIF